MPTSMWYTLLKSAHLTSAGVSIRLQLCLLQGWYPAHFHLEDYHIDKIKSSASTVEEFRRNSCLAAQKNLWQMMAVQAFGLKLFIVYTWPVAIFQHFRTCSNASCEILAYILAIFCLSLHIYRYRATYMRIMHRWPYSLSKQAILWHLHNCSTAWLEHCANTGNQGPISWQITTWAHTY